MHEPLTEEERRARLAAIEAAAGSLAFLKRDWKEAERDRREERELEEARDARRWPAGAGGADVSGSQGVR